MKILIVVLLVYVGLIYPQQDSTGVCFNTQEYSSMIKTLEKIIPYLGNEIDCTLLYKSPEQMALDMVTKWKKKEEDVVEFKVLLWWLQQLGDRGITR